MYKDNSVNDSDGRHLLKTLRLAVWRLQNADQEAGILARVRKVLDRVGGAYDGCRLYRVEEVKGGQKLSVHTLTPDGYWRSLEGGGDWVLEAWRSASTCCRVPKLRGERDWLAGQLSRGVGAILETGFDQGVLAIYREAPIAFSDEDAEILEGLGEVLSGLYYRLQDLQQSHAKEVQLRQVQKLQMVGQLTAEVAHEINNPLAVIIGESSLLLEDKMESMVEDGVRAVYKAGLQARDISERLLHFARGQKAKKEWLNFNRLVQETAVLVRRTLQNEQIEIAEDMEPNLPWVEAHAGQIQQIVLNLIQNSRDAIRQIDGVGRVVLRTSIRQGWVTLQVEDNGPGIPEEIWSDIFEPFFTTKEGDEGTGLGLSVCAGIARDHDGRLLVEKSDRGACMTLELPLKQSAVLASN